MAFPVKVHGGLLTHSHKRGQMISVPSADPVAALVPHTLREPLPGAASGPLAGLTFMVKDLFAIAGRKVSNGNPDFYEHAAPAHETRARHHAFARGRRVFARHHYLR